MRRFAQSAASQPAPGDVVALAEHDCAARLPMTGAGIDARTIDLVVAAEHRDLLHHWRPEGEYRVLAPPVTQTVSLAGGATCPKPEYPTAALRSGAMGTSRVRLTIAADGSVSDARLVGASGPTREHALLDSLAVASFRACRYPADADHPTRRAVLDYVWRID